MRTNAEKELAHENCVMTAKSLGLLFENLNKPLIIYQIFPT